MGLFDSIYIPCPACGHKNELQTKGMAAPRMNLFPHDAVPLMAAAYIITDDEDTIPDEPYVFNCKDCRQRVELKWEPELPKTVAFRLVMAKVTT